MAESALSIDSEATKKELATKGYCVIPDVITAKECDELIGQYKSWLGTFQNGDFPKSRRSIIHQYRIGHFGASWSARLKVKPVYASVWDTEKLLSSFDGVAISRPPEEADGVFDEGKKWFHLDQKPSRKGLHGYQGALYLEEATEMDHCFRVLSHSHRYFEEFFSHFDNARKRSLKSEFYRLTKPQTAWYEKRGCEEVKVSVPKGGVVLWDSRTVHDNVPPVLGRPHDDRWRWVVFICMMPAHWAADKDKQKRAGAYNEIKLTNHWASQETEVFKSNQPKHNGDPMYCVDVMPPEGIPLEGSTPSARLLAAVDEYDFDDGQSNGPGWEPEWDHTMT
ncbi:uncharacterized protein LOC124257100 isoform X1 [Haliotis rubra]|uniref:uncharacterized protein LOC124257100 isoform X1 n=1 Tax=Haliotis rubra TaxID=36100 RepID=UPI001EE62B46|nr:uncharacterized protein LOC124257100 isoform X1 [Haliotis rubra]